MSSIIRAVTFDCWGTLINDANMDDTFGIRVDALIEASTGRLNTDSATELLRRAWQEHHKAWVGGTQYGSPGIAKFCVAELAVEDPLICDRLTEAFEEAGRHGSLEALPGAADTLRKLRAKGIRTALVCDTGLTPGRVVRDFLSDLDLLENLEFCAFSNEVGEPKPNPGIFYAALEAIDAKPDEAAHVGDLLRTDIEGARDIGMKTVRITTVNDDLATRFSWDPTASFGSTAKTGNAPQHEVEDADEVVASHPELLKALKRLGAAL